MSKKTKGSRVTLRRDSLVIQGLFKEVRYKLTGNEGGNLSPDKLLYLHSVTGIGKRSLQEYFGTYAARTEGISISTADLLAQFIRKESFDKFACDFYSNKENPESLKIEGHPFLPPGSQFSIPERVLYDLTYHRSLNVELFQFIQNIHPLIQRNINSENGIDFFIPDPITHEIDTVFCVLNFGNNLIGKEQFRIAKDRIEKLKNTHQNINSLVFICNCIPDRGLFNELNHEIKLLNKNQNINKALLFDIRAFITNSIEKIIMDIKKKMQESNKAFKQIYQRKMKQFFYMEDVPFYTDKSQETQSNLLEYLTKDRMDLNTNRYKRDSCDEPIRNISIPMKNRHWTFVISEFGLGKTCLLLNLAEQLNNCNIPSLFLPLSQFDNKSFNSKNELYKSILNILNSDMDFELSDHYQQLQFFALQEMLERNNEMILLLDGLDEHQNAYQADNLDRIFRCIDKTKSQIIISLRKEFWDDQQGNLEAALSEIAREKRFAILTQWTDTEIKNFIKNYLDKHDLSHEERKGLIDLQTRIQSQDSEKLFGDILTRPIFLNLMIEYLTRGAVKGEIKSKLYEKLLIKKFEFDRKPIFGIGQRSTLQLEIHEDRNKILGKFFMSLEQIANLMNDRKNGCNTVTIQSIPEHILESSTDFLISKEFTLTELLQNSVLVTEDIRTLEGLNIRFAHKSFQNYFHARYLYRHDKGLCKPGTISEHGHYAKEVTEFLKDMNKK